MAVSRFRFGGVQEEVLREGAPCTNCRRGTLKKIKEHHHGGGLGKTIFTGLMKGATKQTASELGLAKATYRCKSCGQEITG